MSNLQLFYIISNETGLEQSPMVREVIIQGEFIYWNKVLNKILKYKVYY